MTPEGALFELLARVGARHGATVVITDHQLSEWPSAAVTAMKKQSLLAKSRPANSAVCPGCERECVMPVHIVTYNAHAPEAFIVCDKRNDINRVTIPTDKLTQWQTGDDAVARFIAASLALRFNGKRQDNDKQLEVGVSTGAKRTQMLCLRCNGELVLVAGSIRIPLAETILFSDGRYAIDADLVRQLVDMSTTGDARHTPSTARREVRKLETETMHEQWRKEYRALKKKRPSMSDVWYSQQIAKQEIAQGRGAETIRKQMKK